MKTTVRPVRGRADLPGPWQGPVQIAPSSYYAAKITPPSGRAVADEQHIEVLRRVTARTAAFYGVRKMHAELNRRDHPIAR